MEKTGDTTGIRIGMWLFLYSEIILFGGLFILYAAYFHAYPDFFAQGGKELNRLVGSLNTLILLVSSFTVAASITAVQNRKKGQAISLLLVSLFCGLIFLINKYFEWSEKIHHDLFPNSQTLQDGPPGLHIFFSLYYVTTGLHALHVILGMILLALSLFFVFKGSVHQERFSLLENAGLYWHLVDLIWIFVFPLFYLVL
ncbi:MAG: cytochrome c oxidase subunit 3 family protein [Candidatus Electrothrix sp. AR3]|nr:cytochrome c oxidase subunit 3 family protein [Candidatus Electrothrix sp. AR3]